MPLFCWTIVCLLSWLPCGWSQEPSATVEPLPVKIAATEAPLRYVGRFDRTDSAGPRCAWTASSVTLRFRGTDLNVLLQSTGNDFWQILVDGTATARPLEIVKGQTRYAVATRLSDAEHTVQLIKRTEFHVGTTQFLGFELSQNGELLPPPPAPERRIEVIGDSISCGYGNEAPTKEEKFTPRAENGSIAYGALAAQRLGADYLCVAWSGKKLWPNNSLLDYYDRILPADQSNQTWDFAQWKPDVVIVNLGTNDFGLNDPDGPGWVSAYRDLIRRLRAQYPEASLYCALGTMLGDWPAPRKPASTIRGYLTQLSAEFDAAGDHKVRFIDFGTQKPENGYGGSWHPSAKTHQLMADQLVARLKKDLGW